METHLRTPKDIFDVGQILHIPIYQRPYVWDESVQWAPLWEDVRRLAERPAAAGQPRHFLGAVVIQRRVSGYGEKLQQWEVVDGQQRLTTLQLLIDAVAAQIQELAVERPADAPRLQGLVDHLEKLTHNAPSDVEAGESRLKVKHHNCDGVAFCAVMDAPAPIAYEDLEESRFTQAHAYFSREAGDWLGAHADVVSRGERLAQALKKELQLVVISLEAYEDSQAIFETLNARGTPLSPTDLIKNLVFQRLNAEGGNAREAVQVWDRFDTKVWTLEERVGSASYSRSSIFLRNWLVAKLGNAEEVSQRQLFPRFKRFVEETQLSMMEIVREIDQSAEAFIAALAESERISGNIGTAAMFMYRTRASKMQAADPVLLWLIDPCNRVPQEQQDAALGHLESWLMRRAILRKSTSSYPRVVAELLARLHRASPDEVGQTVEAYLASLDQETTYWPGDDEVRRELLILPAYQRFARPRLRMLLEAAEDHHRGFTGGGHSRTGHRVERDGRPIEHVLPQNWVANWPLADKPEAEAVRREHVHVLGNLTLLTKSLNSSVSNGPWGGPPGKRAALEKHDVLLLNRELRQLGQERWDESLIDQRSDSLASALLATWPVPEGHTGEITEKNSGADVDVTVTALIAAGLLPVGTQLVSRRSRAVGKAAVVLPNGELQVDDRTFSSPSGAARFAVNTRAEDGWAFWRLPDGRSLRDLRKEYLRAARGIDDSNE